MSIDVFLSSNSRSGYSQDVVDLFAKPCGAKHKFRYACELISDEVLERVRKGTYRTEAQAVLCYVDQTTKNFTPLVMPIRYATIGEVREHGSTMSIVFRLGDFCEFEQLNAFNEAFRTAQPELPEYVDGKIAGKYWLLDNGRVFEGVGRSNELSDWESLISSYYETPNSIEDMPFYRFEGIFDTKTDTAIRSTSEGGDLLYNLRGGKEYEARVYHFHPKSDFPEYTLKVSADDGNLVPLNGDTRVLHTRYDRKDYRFKTKQIILGTDSSLAFQRREKDSGKLIWEDFLLRIRIERSWKFVLLYIGIIATSFAAPFIVRTFTDPNNDWPVTLAAVVGGLDVGIATLLKERIRL